MTDTQLLDVMRGLKSGDLEMDIGTCDTTDDTTLDVETGLKVVKYVVAMLHTLPTGGAALTYITAIPHANQTANPGVIQVKCVGASGTTVVTYIAIGTVNK